MFIVSQRKTNNMARRKKDIIWPHLNDAGQNLSKLWYVEYSLRNPVTDKMERFRHYDGFKELQTIKERFLYAQKLIAEYTNKIKSGEIRFEETAEYEDLLIHGSGASFMKSKKATKGSVVIYISDFIRYKKPEITQKTLETYRSKLRLFVDFLESKKLIDKPISQITNQIIIEFLKVMAEKKHLSRKTIEKYQQILYSFFAWVIKDKNTKIENPVLNIPRIGEIKDEAPVSIPREMRIKLQNRIKQDDPQLWLAICFIYYSAIRPGTELRLMKIKQINFDSKTIVIKNYLAKNNRTEVVDIPDQLFNLITDIWKLQKYDPELYIFGKDSQPGPIPFGKNAMRIRFNKFRDELRLPKEVKYYSWKHSGAQELADNRTSIYELQRHLRHRDIETTEQYLRKRIGQKSSMIKHNFPSI